MSIDLVTLQKYTFLENFEAKNHMLVLTTSESQELLVTQIETLLDAFDIRNSTFDYLFLLYFRKKLIIVVLCTY